MSIEAALARIAMLEADREGLANQLADALREHVSGTQARIAVLEAENARLNMEMVAYRQNLTPKDVEAMQAVIKALEQEKAGRCPPFNKKRSDAMWAIGEVLQAEAKADPTIDMRGLANWMGVAERIYDALNPPAVLAPEVPK